MRCPGIGVGMAVGKIGCLGASVAPGARTGPPLPVGQKSENTDRCRGVGFGRFRSAKIRKVSFLAFVQDMVAMLKNSFKYGYCGQQLNVAFSCPAPSYNQGALTAGRNTRKWGSIHAALCLFFRSFLPSFLHSSKHFLHVDCMPSPVWVLEIQ